LEVEGCRENDALLADHPRQSLAVARLVTMVVSDRCEVASDVAFEV
jgi:hypothetical protein